MTKERLSSLQKWILIQCYKKTILKDNSGLTLFDSFKNHELKDNYYFKYLFRSEILLDYFKCEADNHKFCFNTLILFKNKNNKAQVTLSNSIKNLENKGLIEVFKGSYFRWQGIILTEKGTKLYLSLTSGKKFQDVNNNNPLLLTLN